MKKILIIKTGYSETLDAENGRKVSLGDVLRTTVLLNLYKDHQVTWIGERSAQELLSHNPFIHRLLFLENGNVRSQLDSEYDIIINLEKQVICSRLMDSLTAGKRFGYYVDEKENLNAYPGAEEALKICSSEEYKWKLKKNWVQVLYEMVGETWQGENYVLGYQPKTPVSFHIGFNTNVGVKWPHKAWPMENWKQLEEKLASDYTIDWQRGLNNLYDYMDWIGSCRVIVTNDSLGLHLALALGKKVIAMFGPTLANELHKNTNLIKLTANGNTQKKGSMKDIRVTRVEQAVRQIMEEKSNP